jgi:large subunit ribosomal protein L4
MVNASKKKPYRQKGTGQARHGTRVAMNMRGGGVVFGPQPRDYSYQMPKKMVKSALRSALSLRRSESKLFVVKGWAPKGPKTKDAKKILDQFGESVLVIDSRDNATLMRSVRNLPRAKFLPVEGINVRDILAYDNLIIGEAVIGGLVARLKSKPSRKEREAKNA